MKSKALINWEQETEIFVDYFVERYFGKNTEVWWVAEQVGGTLVAADYFFDMNTMVDYVRYSYTKNQMFGHYEYALDIAIKKSDGKDVKNAICIRDWKKLK